MFLATVYPLSEKSAVNLTGKVRSLVLLNCIEGHDNDLCFLVVINTG